MIKAAIRRRLADRDSRLTRLLAGFSLRVINHYENYSADFRTNGEFAILEKLATRDLKVFFDVGANLGEYAAELARSFPGAAIHSFEIVPEIAASLRANVGHLPGVRINDFGLSDEAGELDVKRYAGPTGVNSIYDFPHEGESEWIKGRVITGDAYVKEHGIRHIDFLKMDVEGAEPRVLRGFSETFRAGKIDIVQFEYGQVNIITKHLLRDHYAFFEELGFVVGKIYPKRVEFRDYELRHEDFLGLNYLAVRKERRDLLELLSR